MSATANGSNGTYTAFATAAAMQVDFSLTNGSGKRTSPVATGYGPIDTYAGQAFASTTVATFTEPDTSESAAGFTATINWGDGNSSQGTILGGDGDFSVTGGHTYSTISHFTTTISISNQGQTPVDVNTTVNVADAPITATGTTFNGTAGTSATATAANFADYIFSRPGEQLPRHHHLGRRNQQRRHHRQRRRRVLPRRGHPRLHEQIERFGLCHHHHDR